MTYENEREEAQTVREWGRNGKGSDRHPIHLHGAKRSKKKKGFQREFPSPGPTLSELLPPDPGPPIHKNSHAGRPMAK
jgi:hypothetical protein